MPTLDLLERRVVEHEAALGCIFGKPNSDDTTRLDARDDSLAERAVPDAVTGRERGSVVARRHFARARTAVVRPRRRLEAIAFDELPGAHVERDRLQPASRKREGR